MEYETNQPQASVWQRLKDSPRTVSALIIILVIAAAMYAFSGPDQQPEAGPAEGEEARMEETAAMRDEAVEAPAELTQDTLKSQSEALPEAEVSLESYTEAAQAGDGTTHLARRAATRYLADKPLSYAVTNEHRIYIEDYVQKKIGAARLEVGDERSIPFALIEEAVEAAGELSPAQLKNLSKYTSALK